MYYIGAIFLSISFLQEIAGFDKQSLPRFFWGGSTPYSAPYAAVIFRDNNRRNRCGGVLISEEFVLTAAQCAAQYKVDVVLGAHDLNQPEHHQQHRNIPEKNIIVHPNYQGYNHDIALIKLPEKAKISEFVKPIKMAERDADLFVGADAAFYGWGSNWLLPDTLQYKEATIIGNNQCYWSHIISGVDKSVMCAVHKVFRTPVAACNGDSGGPLVVRKDDSELLVGIAAVRPLFCSLRPTIFTRVSEYVDWIYETIGKPGIGGSTNGGSSTEKSTTRGSTIKALIPVEPTIGGSKIEGLTPGGPTIGGSIIGESTDGGSIIGTSPTETTPVASIASDTELPQ